MWHLISTMARVDYVITVFTHKKWREWMFLPLMNTYTGEMTIFPSIFLPHSYDISSSLLLHHLRSASSKFPSFIHSFNPNLIFVVSIQIDALHNTIVNVAALVHGTSVFISNITCLSITSRITRK
jgi:hypothetical protein